MTKDEFNEAAQELIGIPDVTVESNDWYSEDGRAPYRMVFINIVCRLQPENINKLNIVAHTMIAMMGYLTMNVMDDGHCHIGGHISRDLDPDEIDETKLREEKPAQQTTNVDVPLSTFQGATA